MNAFFNASFDLRGFQSPETGHRNAFYFLWVNQHMTAGVISIKNDLSQIKQEKGISPRWRLVEVLYR
jgi:hypothetical protein